MRKALITSIGVAALSALVAGTAMAGMVAGSGIVGSKHDMRNYASGNGGIVDGEGRVCAYCHTPHHAMDDDAATYAPLWSHDFTPLNNFSAYASDTFDGTVGSDPLVGPSRLCMSCHDGVTAADSYYGNVGTAANEGDAFGDFGVGLNGFLHNDHPIGFAWADVVAADLEIKGGTDMTYQIWTDNTVTLGDILHEDATFTCASCHDVHNSASVEDYFLYGEQQDSAFCTGCHDK